MVCPRRLLLLSVLVAPGCWPGSPASKSFSVVRTSPSLSSGSEPLLLNDSVTVYFSAPVDPLSVTSDSVTVVDERGHGVPGNVRAGQNWVTFEPRPPVSPDLGDGSFQPGGRYRLQIAGYPRPDAVRSVDGRRLASAETHPIVVIARDRSPAGGQTLLRPLSIEIPFVLRPYEGVQLLPADAPRLRVHFTLPVLPTTATADAFRIQWLDDQEPIRPRSVRVVSSAFDEYPGSAVEVDLGALPRRSGRDGARHLKAKDVISVSVQNVPAPLRDYRGTPVLAPADQLWSVVAGTSISLVTWPAEGDGIAAEDPTKPGFEFVSGVIRPRVRVEAGDGCLGTLRPLRDLVLVPGVPFDRGDGVMVASRGSVFPFLAIEIPAGITVRVEGGAGPVVLLASGGVHIAGSLVIATGSAPLHTPQHGVAVADLLENATCALVAAGDVRLTGRIGLAAPLAGDQSALTIASAGRIHLLGQLPYNTILAVESSQESDAGPTILGSRGQVTTAIATFTYGLPAGAHWTARGCSTWRPLPPDRDGAVVRLLEGDAALRASWQSAPAHAVRRGEPDLTVGRVGRIELMTDQERIAVAPGSFVRFHIEAEVQAGQPLPMLRELRLVDR